MSRKFGIGILGYGRFAEKWLKSAIPNSRQGRLVAIQVRSRPVQMPGVSIYYDINEFLADPQVDAVYVTSPNEYHEEHVCRSLETGKHVLCEKPMAVLPAQARRMIAAARHHRRYLAVGHMLRFSPALKSTKALLEKKAVGQLLYARAVFSYRLTREMRSWAHDKKIAGGGALLDGGIHCIDSLRYLLESPRLSARACVLRSPAGARVETSAACILESSVGCFVQVSAHSNAPYDSRLEITGSRGRLTLEGFVRCAGKVILEFHPEGRDRPVRKVIEVRGVHERQIDAFCRMATSDPGNTLSAQDGLRNLEIVHALYARS
jgi:predicted dehydrogenase